MPGAGSQNSPTINIIDNNRNMSTNNGGGRGATGSGMSCGDGFPFNLVQTNPAMQSIMPGGQPVNPMNMMGVPMNMQNMMLGMREQGCLPVEMPKKRPKQFNRTPLLPMLPQLMANPQMLMPAVTPQGLPQGMMMAQTHTQSQAEPDEQE